MPRNRDPGTGERRLFRSLVLLSVMFWVSPISESQIFEDGFESGNSLAWSSQQPPLDPPFVFRFSDLALRDPHVFIEILPGVCFDFTDEPLPAGLGPSFNQILADSLVMDDDGDGALDSSPLLAFRGLEIPVSEGRLDQGSGDCGAPSPPADCDWRRPPVPVTTPYDAIALGGICLESEPGTTSGYSPEVNAPSAPCFVSAAVDSSILLGGVSFALEANRSAATFDGVPASSMSQGLAMGFLSEAVADTILLPSDLPIVGGQPISILFPGGGGNCASGDDRDLGPDGQSGWWVYLAFEASEVVFVGA